MQQTRVASSLLFARNTRDGSTAKRASTAVENNDLAAGRNVRTKVAVAFSPEGCGEDEPGEDNGGTNLTRWQQPIDMKKWDEAIVQMAGDQYTPAEIFKWWEMHVWDISVPFIGLHIRSHNRMDTAETAYNLIGIPSGTIHPALIDIDADTAERQLYTIPNDTPIYQLARYTNPVSAAKLKIVEISRFFYYTAAWHKLGKNKRVLPAWEHEYVHSMKVGLELVCSQLLAHGTSIRRAVPFILIDRANPRVPETVGQISYRFRHARNLALDIEFDNGESAIIALSSNFIPWETSSARGATQPNGTNVVQVTGILRCLLYCRSMLCQC
ncbi:hypothetical protein BDV95DRAFT_375817 [Massariosphaeria phaeospora]|uniref:Uncharacterized protein n=1 Tax=Massariosphaeria phaeospora TaxID=100035 RepID=A0A7C8MN04_9PLEO|nr:hypothetical protein BDV95DRAFT_375817 [Massariosphaeria phaeospora]